MYHYVPFYRSGSNGDFRYKYLENRTVYFVENYMIVKLKYCIIRCTIFIFFQMIKYHFNSEYFTFILVVKLLSALSVYMVFDLQVFLVSDKLILSFLTLCVERPSFEGMVNIIYPPELQLNRANVSGNEAPFLDLHLSISNGFITSITYDKHDDFDLDIVKFPFLMVMFNLNVRRQSTCLVTNPITVDNFAALLICRWVRRQTL